MRRFTAYLFGYAMPMSEILLVIAGLGLLGWEGLVYTWTGVWTTILVSVIDIGGRLTHTIPWLAHLPLDKALLVCGVALFFLMPPAHDHW